MQKKPVTDHRRSSLRVQVASAAVLFACLGAGLAAFTAYQFNALVHLTEQINVAGRLRMLSQHSALLTQQIAQGDKSALEQLASTQREFETSLIVLQNDATFGGDPQRSSTLPLVEAAWREQTKLANLLSHKNGSLTQDEAELLAQVASATLKAAESNVAIAIPKAQQAKNILTTLLLVGAFSGGAAPHCRPSVFAPSIVSSPAQLRRLIRQTIGWRPRGARHNWLRR